MNNDERKAGDIMNDETTWITNTGDTPSYALVDIEFDDGDIVHGKSPGNYIWKEHTFLSIKRWRPHNMNSLENTLINHNQVDFKDVDIPTSTKKDYYLDKEGDDWIDDCARKFRLPEFRGAMKFTIGKYIRRAGKKDDILKELEKIADYTNRWIQYEKNLKDKS